ncbi:MAG: glycoside hydrolase family 172 protein [Bacillota bacterium]
MRTRQSWMIAAGVGLLALVVGAARAGENAAITTASLIPEMTDLKQMAEFPSPAYTCKQFSSYDRAAKSPTENWFANGDCGQYLRTEDRNGRKEFVMMDATGPGAIVRIWSANPNGTLRIYIDGNETPVIETPMSELLGGKYPGLPRPIAGEYSKGWNLYFPIPYAKSCKVTSDKGDFYYHVNYRTYEPGTKVVSFTADQIKSLEKEIAKLGERLASPRGNPADMAGQAQPYSIHLEPGESMTSDELTGPMAIARVTMKVSASDRDAALRGVILKGTFDGEQTIETPVGDLFGSAPGINAYASLPLGMTKDGEMYCHWFMPFKTSAVFAMTNTSKAAVDITGELQMADYQWTDRSMHFHAKWRAQFDVPTRPMIDWNYMTAQGKGVFAGVAFFIDNPVKDWWGEGDEKIYVDGETFPSHFGTGTEDYYGYAWCWPGLFTHAYHNQPRCDGPSNYGRTSVNRFHIFDRIPFTKDFKFDMELWHWNEKCKVNMAVITYWYAMPGAKDGFKPIRAEDAIIRPMPEYQIPRVAGALEGEAMKILEKVGTADPQDWDGLSAGRQLWWHAGMKPGDKLVLGFEVKKAGTYRVLGHFLKAKDYGIHQLAINGKNAGQPIDFYNDGVVPTKELDLGTFDLKEGQNQLSVTVVGANEKAVKSYMFGLDYLLLKPIE